jgi:hypothetical protein
MIPFYVSNPSVPDYYPKVRVPDEIVRYCDDKISFDRESLQYIDCIWYHMGYYGDSKKLLREIRDKYSIRPVFD